MSFFRFVDDPISVTKRSDGALKSYESVSDNRAWTNDKVEKSKFIHNILKRNIGEASSDDNEVSRNISDAVQNMEIFSKNDLVNQIKTLKTEIKTKDVELDKIHSLFKITSKKLEEMDRIIKEKHSFENQLQDSRTQLQTLKSEQQVKDEQLRKMRKEMDELKCQSTSSVETEDTWNAIENKAEMLDEVKNERNILKSQLCKMVGISDVLAKLKTRADEADRMEQEISRLQRELQRFSQDAGDKVSLKRVGSACKQCSKTIECYRQLKAILESEQKKNIETEAERNVLRERCRAVDVVEAENIFYKTKYEEAECKISKLKEMMIRSDGSENEVRELQQRLATGESQLKESERHAEELIKMVERLEIDLKEREVYIESITRRMQQEIESNTMKKAVSMDSDFVPSGKVQSIVEKLTVETMPTNCKCGIDNCQCLNVIRRDSSTLKMSSLRSPNLSNGSIDKANTVIKNLEPIPSEIKTESRESSELSSECHRLQSEFSCEDIRKLRSQNASLDNELQRLKSEMEEMVAIMKKVDEQRNSNTFLEEEKTKLSSAQSQEFMTKESVYLSTLTEKEEELCKLRKMFEDLEGKYKDEREKTERLEENLAAAWKELDELRPLENVRESCKILEDKLIVAEANKEDRAEKVQELQGNCDEICQENKSLKKEIVDLQVDLDEQRKYAKKLADQLCQRKSFNKEKIIEPSETADNRETLRKCIKDLRQHYDALKVEKHELIQSYERKLKTLEEDMKNFNFNRRNAESVKKCQCDCLVADDCDDWLLKKALRCGINSLKREELIDLHNRVRSALVKLRKLPRVGLKVPLDFYTKIADEICQKYNLSSSFPVLMKTDDIPVKDYDLTSTKTLPPLLRSSSRKNSRNAQRKPRARSSGAETDKTSRLVTFCKQKTR